MNQAKSQIPSRGTHECPSLKCNYGEKGSPSNAKTWCSQNQSTRIHTVLLTVLTCMAKMIHDSKNSSSQDKCFTHAHMCLRLEFTLICCFHTVQF